MAVYTTIDDPEAYFQTVIYTGNGSDDHAITFPGDTDMSPNLIWQKNRTDAVSHGVFDTVRGIGGGSNTFRLLPDSGNAEDDASNTVKSADSDGFTLGTNANLNGDSDLNVAWCWKESATAGFDIVLYTGNGSARTIAHSLSAVPSMMIVKNRGSGYGWQVYHHKNTSAPETEIIYLHAATATADSNVEWNDTAPTSSVFTVGTDVGVNENTKAMIAYLFTEKQGFSKFGVYTGNNNANGNFIYTGFRPAFVLSKDSASGQQWHMIDNKRDPFNDSDNAHLAPAEAWNEATTKSERGTMQTDFLSNGFKLNTDSSNTSGTGTHIYMAFAEAPFVNSKGVPCNAR